MDLRALKLPDKKPVGKVSQVFIECKIPVPFKSPFRKKATRKLSNKIVCSTPVNSANKCRFEDDNQNMSPIRNPSSTTSKSSTPLKLADEVVLASKLSISRNNSTKKKSDPGSSVTEIQESCYRFPLLDKVETRNLVLCDSDTETFPKNTKNIKSVHSRKTKNNISNNDSTEKDNKSEKPEIFPNNKRLKKTAKLSKNVKTIQQNTKNSEENIMNSRTRSKTELIVTETANCSNENTTIDKKKINSRTINSASPKSKKHKTENDLIEVVPNQNIESEPVQLRSKIGKIKKDILNGKTKNSNNLLSSEINIKLGEIDNDSKIKTVDSESLPKKNSRTRKKKKEILNSQVADGNQINIQILDVSHGTKSTVVVHKSVESNENSKNKNTPANIVEEIDNLNEKIDTGLRKKVRQTKTKKLNRSKSNSAIRKSSRRRIPSCKYWVANPEKLNNDPLIPTDKLVEEQNLEDEKSKEPTDKSSENKIKLSKKQDKVKPSTQLPKDNPPKQLTQSKKKLSIKSTKSSEPKILTTGKIRKSLALEQKAFKYSTPKKVPKSRAKLQFSDLENNSYTTEEENDVPRDTIMISETREVLNSEKGLKRKVESNIEIYQPKKSRIQTDKQFSFQNMALLADVSPAKPGGLADVQLGGKRCLLGCFGKFPRNCTPNIQNPDISLGLSLNNGQVTTGVLEINPAGRKKYEYAKRVDLLFLILGGTAEVGIGNSSQVLRLGQDFYVPKDTPYYIVNVSNTEKLVVYFVKISK